jgi:hypothetical protein
MNIDQLSSSFPQYLFIFTRRKPLFAGSSQTHESPTMNRIYPKIFCLAIILSVAKVNFSFGQLVINEICPTNISINQNHNGEYNDWIELYNNSGAAMNLSGYGLTDDQTKPYDFKFPSYTLNAGSRVLVFASGKSNEVIANHWEMAVDAASSWRYVAGSATIDTNWRNTTFTPPSGWGTGAGSIGFGDGDDNTTISVGASVMMRKTINIPDTSQILKAVLMMDYDDGFVAYLNGVEIARSNLGTEGFRPQWNELALSSHEAKKYQGIKIDSFYIKRTLLKSIIRPGTNVLAIEVHNAPINSDDMTSLPYLFFGMKSSGSTFSSIPSWFLVPPVEYFNSDFKLARTGETVYLYNPGGLLVDSKAFPPMLSNNSIGRKPDGSSGWCYFSTPTPNTSNNSSTCYNGYASTPVFSKLPGYYTSTQSLTISQSTPGGVIRYTTNGDIPTTSSPAYSGTMSISSTRTIRARVFASGYLPSPIVTNDYIIGASTRLSTFCITTDSLNLWDYNTGIYVMGPNASTTSPYKGANFWQDWEKPASVEYFDKNKNLVIGFDADIKIYGNYSRAKPQKSFEIKLSDKYGTGEFIYPIYPDKPYIDKISNIVLRNSGTDWNKVHFRDAYMERMLKSTYSGYLATEPCIMYLNGEYWGVYHINENHDQHWMKNNFGLDKDQIDYLIENGSSMDIKLGDDASFWTLYNYATNQSPTSSSYYSFVNNYLDLKSYTDYFAAETFYNNGDWIGDWTNNIKLWRPNKPGSKWRYLVYDLDFGLALSGSVNDDRLEIARNPTAFSYTSELFDAVLKNPTYKRYFINRYCDLLNTIWLYSNMDAFMHSYKDTMSYDMPAHFAKWGSSTTTWNSYISSMMSFANARPGKMRDFIQSQFALTGKVTLTLQSSPAGAGRIEISTITPTTLPWSGIYYNGNPVTITAIPNPGYTFDHFHSNNTITTNNYNQSVTYNYTANDQITAFFTGASAAVKICVSELNYNSRAQNDAGDWIELHNYANYAINISGWKLKDSNDNHEFVFPTGTVLSANGYLVVCEDSEKFQFQFPNVHNVIGVLGFNFSNAGDQIRLYNHLGNLYLSFFYQELAPWPVVADGQGYTCELSNNTANPNDGNSWFPGCIGGSPGVAYSPLLSTPVSISGSTTFCSGGSVTLHATNNAGYTYQWLNNNVNIAGATDSLFTATQTGNYSVRVSYQGCTTVTPNTNVSVVTQQPPPVTTGNSRCGSGDVTLNATASDTVYWYDAPSGGNLVGTGNSLFIPYVLSTKTYYAITGSTCSSSAVATVATILTPAAPPVSSNASRCGPGSVTLVATDTAAMRWYNASVGGGLVQTGGTFVTNTLTGDTVFYVEAGTACPSTRTQVNVTVNITPDPVTFDGSRCGMGTVTLNASSPYAVAWYNNQSGGNAIGNGSSFTTGNIAVTDTFYAEANGGCPSERVMAIAMVNPVPLPPTTSDVTSCTIGTVSLTATATEQVDWFDVPSGGNSLYTGSNFTTPFLTSTTTFYVQAGYICPSARVPVQAIVGAAPAPPTGSDVNRCGTGSVMLNASSPEAIYWFNQPTGGTLLVASDNYQTPSLSVTTTYYAEAGNGCRSSRTPIKAIVDPLPAAPLTSNVTNCGSGSVTLTATSTESIRWYSAASGGTLLQTGGSYVTPVLSNTTTYYVETGDNCISSRIPVQVIIANQPADPTVTNDSRCGSGTLTLLASSPESLSWYNVASGGLVIGTGSSFTTPSISSTTTYYVEAYNGCTTNRVPVIAMVNPVPAPPVSADQQRCGAGTLTLTANSPEQIYWYSSPSGGASIATGTSFTTPSLSVTTTYYVEAGDNCRSSRVAVVAIINNSFASPTVTDDSNCGPGTVTLSASSPGTVKWYASQHGGQSLATGYTFTTPSISVTTTYWAEAGNGGCQSNRVPAQAIIASQPSTPVTNDDNRCGPGTLTLTASSTAPVFWYTSSSGGSSIGSGSSFITPSISTTTTYYAQADNGCQSSRVAAIAEVDAVPSPPTSSNVNRCGSGSMTLNASSPENMHWYTQASGGSSVGSGSNFTTPALSTTTTYYVDAGSLCRSTRTQVIALVVPVPSSPTVTGSSNCGPGTVTLNASSASSLNWYANSSGGNPIAFGTTYTTQSISNTTTYYVEAANGNCISNRVPVVAAINPVPAPPVANNNSRCGSGTVTLSASSSATVKWYTTSTGGTLLHSGSTFTTPSINTTTTYYAEADNGCKSARVMVVAIVEITPAAPTASNVSRCDPGTLTLTASSPEQIYWYTTSTGGNPVDSGTTFNTPSINTTRTYYVETGNDCRSSRIPVLAIVNLIPAPPALTPGSRCGQGTIDLTASSSSLVRWFDSPGATSSIGVGLLFTTPVINTTTTYYAEAGVIGCASSRASVVATVNAFAPTPTAINNSRCGPGTLTLSANGIGQLYWYSTLSSTTILDSGTTYLTPSINSTKTYYVETTDGTCHSARTSVQAIINAIPAAPSVSDASRCSAGTVTLGASSSYPIYWYDAQTGGNLLNTGSSFTTPVISSNTTYWVETGGTCRSPRAAVHALITAAPNSPVLSDTSVCGQGSIILEAQSPVRVSWFDVPSGGTVLDTGLYFSTALLTTTTTYFAEAGYGCNSPRVPVVVTVTPVPAAPTATDASRCGAGSVTLNANAAQTIYWYDMPAGGAVLDSGSSFVTPSISTTTTYYVETGTDCRSARIAVLAVISPSPIISSSDGFVCGTGPVTMSVVASVPADSVMWFDNPGGTLIGTGYSYTSPSLTINTTYYVEAHGNCPAVPLPMNAFVFPSSSVNIGPDTLFVSSGQVVNLNAGAGFNSYVWSTGDSTPSIQVTLDGIYSVVTTDNNGCTATDQIYISVVTSVNQAPAEVAMLVYPNPAHDKLSILLPDQKQKNLTLKVTSADGKVVKREELKANGSGFYKTISVADVAAGIYFVTLENSSYFRTVRILVE